MFVCVRERESVRETKKAREMKREIYFVCACVCLCVNRNVVVGIFMFFITLLGPETLLGPIVRTRL